MDRQDLTDFQFELLDNLAATEAQAAAADDDFEYQGAVMVIEYERDGETDVIVHSTSENLAAIIDLLHAAVVVKVADAIKATRAEALEPGEDYV